MLKRGILNPHVLSLLSRVRHTNTLVIADRGFPFWPGIETIDLSLIDDIPRVPDVLQAVLAHWQCGRIQMAEEFRSNSPEKLAEINRLVAGRAITYQAHETFKLYIPQTIGLIRTGDSTPYANMILESA